MKSVIEQGKALSLSAGWLVGNQQPACFVGERRLRRCVAGRRKCFLESVEFAHGPHDKMPMSDTVHPMSDTVHTD
jgi:hypothetical protein